MKKIIGLWMLLAACLNFQITLAAADGAALSECGTDNFLNGTLHRKDNGPTEDKEDSGIAPTAWLNKLFISSAFAASAPTIEARIKDCARISGSTKKSKSGVTWNLVARKRDSATGKYHEVWKDSKSGLVWGDALDSNYSHYNAVKMDSDNKKVVQETACASKEGQSANAGISEKSFGLPSDEEFQAAEKNGLRKIVPNMNS